MSSCSKNSTPLPPLVNCKQATNLCLTVTNMTNEPIIIEGGTLNYCATIEQNKTVVFNSTFGDCWNIHGVTSGKKYVSQWCTFSNQQIDVLDMPDSFPSYKCRQTQWTWLLIGWIIILFIILIMSKTTHVKYNKNVQLLGIEDSVTLKSQTTNYGFFILVVCGIIVILFLCAMTDNGQMPFQKTTCSQCKNRGDLWSWTQRSDKDIFCKFLGLCTCRSALQEKNCFAYANKNSENISYSKSIAQDNTNYNCACKNFDNNQTLNCLVSNSGQFCEPCK